MRRLFVLASCLAALPCLAGEHLPYIPARDDAVLERVPSISDARVRAFDGLRSALDRAPGDVTRVVQLARAYVDYGRDTGDARYLGRAEAVIAPLLDHSPAPIAVLLIHATILQSRHDFAQARALLLHIVDRDPDNAQAWLTLASVAEVQGDMRAARAACAHLLDASDPLLPAGCLASLNALNGYADNAYRLLSQLWPQAKGESIAVQSWLQGILADAAKYLGRSELADAHFRLALQLTPGDNFLLADYADFLLDQKRPQDAFDLVRAYASSDTSFLRQVYAEAALGSPQAAADTAEMARRFAELEVRGTYAYRREQAGFVLHLQQDARHALVLAQQNWTVQRAPEDMRILLEAALAAGVPQAAQAAIEQVHATHLQYPLVVSLAGRAQAQSADQAVSEVRGAAPGRP